MQAPNRLSALARALQRFRFESPKNLAKSPNIVNMLELERD